MLEKGKMKPIEEGTMKPIEEGKVQKRCLNKRRSNHNNEEVEEVG